MLILNILSVILAIAIYVKGECDTKWLGKSNKIWKYFTGFPIGIGFAIALHSWIPLLCLVTFAIACSFGYGEKNWLTKLLGKRGAITFCGLVFGLATAPILLYYSLLQALSGAVGWYTIAVLDDKDIVKEPFVAILRGVAGLWLLVLYR